MDCDEAAEFVSALYDGETVPRTAAEHIGACEVCKARWTSYTEIGIELRRVASLEIPEAAKPRLWDKPQWKFKLWWKKGWETMRIPRIAFAGMSAGLVVMASSLAVVGVRAYSEGTVVMLKVMPPESERAFPCPLSAIDKNNADCGAVAKLKAGVVTYQIKLLRKDGNRVQLGVRTRLGPSSAPLNLSGDELDGLPEKQYWFEPGDKLKVDVPGLGDLTVTGEWMDHMPSLMAGNQNLDPAPAELRINSPLLLRDGKVVGDLEGGNAIADQPQDGVVIFIPGDGLFKFSRVPFADGITGHVRLNRVCFESAGRSYVLLTGTPISRSENIWVLHEPNFKPSEELSKEPYISVEKMSRSDASASGTK